MSATRPRQEPRWPGTVADVAADVGVLGGVANQLIDGIVPALKRLSKEGPEMRYLGEGTLGHGEKARNVGASFRQWCGEKLLSVADGEPRVPNGDGCRYDGAPCSKSNVRTRRIDGCTHGGGAPRRLR